MWTTSIAVVVEHRLEALVRLRQARLLSRALGRRADHARDLDPEPAQRLDVHDADEPRPDDAGPHRSEPNRVVDGTRPARVGADGDRARARNSTAFDASTPPVTISGTSREHGEDVADVLRAAEPAGEELHQRRAGAHAASISVGVSAPGIHGTSCSRHTAATSKIVRRA